MTWFTMFKGRKECTVSGCNQRLSPSATSKGTTICATCVRRSGKGRVGFNKRGKKQ